MADRTKRAPTPRIKKPTPHELRQACAKVERFARLIGRDCQIILADDHVEVAPLSWSGSVTAPTLFEALTQAEEESRDD